MPAADPFPLPVWRLENSGEATAKRGEVAVLEMQALRLRRSEGLGVITHRIQGAAIYGNMDPSIYPKC